MAHKRSLSPTVIYKVCAVISASSVIQILAGLQRNAQLTLCFTAVAELIVHLHMESEVQKPAQKRQGTYGKLVDAHIIPTYDAKITSWVVNTIKLTFTL